MKVILAVTVWEITDQQFYEVKKGYERLPNHHWINALPEYCVREDNGHFDWTANYYQFYGDFEPMEYEKDNTHILFDYEPVDQILKKEINNVGFDSLFHSIDFRPIFNKLKRNKWNLVGIPITQHIIIDLDYFQDGDDWDLNVIPIGYLDSEMNLVTKDDEFFNDKSNTTLAKEIINYVSRIMGVPDHYNIAENQKREFVTTRYMAMALIKCNTNMSLNTIGNFFGKKDHATVLHALKTVNNLMDTDKKFKEKMDYVVNNLRIKYTQYIPNQKNN